MDQTAPNSAKLKQDQEREKHLRFEKVAERSTYLVVFGALALALLPFDFPISRLPVIVLGLLLLPASFIWFHLIPKKFIGSTKTLLYFFISVGVIFLAVHLSKGIQSFVIFIFYLAVLRASAYINRKGFITLVTIISGLLLIEALFFSGSIAFIQSLSLWMLHTWALACIAVFGRYIYNEEKRIEESEESSKLRIAKQIDSVKNEFVFVVSKKLKEPVALLSGYLASTLQKIDNNWTRDQKDFLQKTSENTERLAKLISDLSDLSGIENQKIRLDLQVTNLNQIMGSTLSDFSMRAAEKNISLKFLPSSENVSVVADQSRLHEILANLIDNAIKYSSPSAQVKISFKPDGKMAQIDIADNGEGIPQVAKDHLFEKFYRVNRKGSEAKGTGLGLFVTKELILRQGGKIWFESEPGVGTTFHFTLPLALNYGK